MTGPGKRDPKATRRDLEPMLKVLAEQNPAWADFGEPGADGLIDVPESMVGITRTYQTYLVRLGGFLANVVALYSRPPSTEGEGEVTVADLIRRATRRLNPTRVIVGEILGDEVGPVLDVFSGSTRGSGCTIHARSARGAVRRFEQHRLAAHPPVPVEQGRPVAHSRSRRVSGTAVVVFRARWRAHRLRRHRARSPRRQRP